MTKLIKIIIPSFVSSSILFQSFFIPSFDEDLRFCHCDQKRNHENENKYND